jgi:hypothetical protein
MTCFKAPKLSEKTRKKTIKVAKSRRICFIFSTFFAKLQENARFGHRKYMQKCTFGADKRVFLCEIAVLVQIISAH